MRERLQCIELDNDRFALKTDLMFIKLHGPPLYKWKPQLYVTSWLAQHRSTTDTRTRVAAAAAEDDLQNPDPL